MTASLIEFREPTLAVLEEIENVSRGESAENLVNYLIENGNSTLYKILVEKQVLSHSSDVAERIQTSYNNAKQVIEESGEEIERRLLELAFKSMNLEKLENYENNLLEVEAGSSIKMDIYLCKIRISIIIGDRAMLIASINGGKKIYDSGADWDRKNRFKVYLGLYSLMKTDFEESAKQFADSLMSFEATELLSLEKCVLYLIFTSLLTFSRSDLENKVLNSSDVMKFNYIALAECIQKCDYKNLFKELIDFISKFENDYFIWPFREYFCKEIKILGYQQFLLSYQSVHIDKMAEAFCIGVEHLEEDLRNFIIEGRIHCEIDRVDGVIRITGTKEDDSMMYEMGDGIVREIRKSTSA